MNYRIYIIIPAHNEEAFLPKTLTSLTNQTQPPEKIVVVNDNSTDGTQEIIDRFSEEYRFISGIRVSSAAKSEPGSKVVEAFYKGLEVLDDNFDILCKFDADLIFPEDYLSRISRLFSTNPKCGIAGGFCAIAKGNTWVLENLTNKNHVRGALKAYRKECWEQISGLRKSMGWDTVDELIARYHGWMVITDEELIVKHLKPTTSGYSKIAGIKQGQAFKKMRYGFWLTLIAGGKLALKKRSFTYLIHCLRGFLGQEGQYIISPDEGRYLRKFRWKGIANRFKRNT